MEGEKCCNYRQYQGIERYRGKLWKHFFFFYLWPVCLSSGFKHCSLVGYCASINYCNEWMMYMKRFTLNLKNTALKPDKLLHATCRLTYSAVQHTVNYVQLSSKIELVAPYLQSINLPVQCSWKICTNFTKSATFLYKNFL